MPQRTGKDRINQGTTTNCDECGIIINGYNTRGHHGNSYAGRAAICGKCYLKIKREERRAARESNGDPSIF